MNPDNPFEIVKSVDYSDAEINEYWVELSEAKFKSILDPKSPVPVIILGGKGSGKTHIVRHLSFNSQRLRYTSDIITGIQDDGYIGVYYNLGGLNEGRFEGKGINPDVWKDISIYSLDLSIAQRMLSIFQDILNKMSKDAVDEKAITNDVLKIFNTDLATYKIENILELIDFLSNKRKKIDFEVNNCSLTGKLNVQIETNRGDLIYHIPEIIVQHVKELENVRFVYVFDELENISKTLQIYIQTLIRERRGISTIILCGRLYSIKTNATYCDGEENIEGSEYTKIKLDDIYRNNSSNFRSFCYSLYDNRLKNFLKNDETIEFESQIKDIEDPDFNKLNLGIEFIDLNAEEERKYFKKLRKQLNQYYPSKSEIDVIIENLKCQTYPLVEKAAIYLFYQSWLKHGKLVESSSAIKNQIQKFTEGDHKDNDIFSILSHYKLDLYAQILREYGQNQRYQDINGFINLCGDLPRAFLQLLKYTFSYSVFLGEDPLVSHKISVKAQSQGVRKTSEWFFEDVNILGDQKKHVQDAIYKLGNFFRELRFSDKPAECSVSSLSLDRSKLTDGAMQTLEMAISRSLLIEKSTRRGKSDKGIEDAYQLNPMLAPKWDLPYSKRGTIPLSPEFANSIFDPYSQLDYDALLKKRIEKMNVPFDGYYEQEELFND